MKTSNNCFASDGITHRQVIHPQNKGEASIFRRLPGRFAFAALLAGLLFLLSGATTVHATKIPANCNGSGLGITLFTSSPDVHIGDTLYYSVNVFNGIPGTGRIVCDAEAIHAWIVTPDGASNSVVLGRTYLSNAQSDFYPDVVSYVVRAQDILPDGSVRATANDTGIIHQNDTDSIGGGFQGVNTEVSLPCIGLNVQCVGSSGETGAITFSGMVTNCGNNTLVNVTVSNSVNGGLFHVAIITNLLSGQTAPFSGSWIPLNPCSPSTATFTARGADEFTTFPRTVTSSASTTCQNTLAPGIRVTKSCPTGPVAPGQLLTFSGSVSNTGNVTLTNIVVLNNQPVANTIVFTLASLAPGAVTNFTGSYPAPTNCSVSDTLSGSGNSLCGVAVSGSTSATCPITTTPQIAVSANCPITPIVPGSSVTYSGSVMNTGNNTLTNVIVTSDRPAPNTTVFTVATLAPGVSANFTATYTVPTNACSITTTFTSSGRDICTLIAVTNAVAPTCSVVTAPAIGITLACPAVTASAGGLMTYTGFVTNSGTVLLNNVTVVNSQSSPSTVLIVPSLAPHTAASFAYSFIAPMDACTVSSTATVTGSDNCSSLMVTNAASATCPLTTVPGIRLTKSCPVGPVAPGQLLTFSGSVSNSGNVTLTNIVVLNSQPVANTAVFSATTLAPGQMINFTGSYLAPTNCSVSDTLTGSGRSLCGVAVSGSASAICPITTAPAIVVTQTCPVTPVGQGGLLTFSGTVRNAGNSTLTNIVVVNNWPNSNVIFTAVSLAPGVTTNFTGSYVVPGNCCQAWIWVKASGQGCDGVSVTDTDSGTCTVLTAPNLIVTKACVQTFKWGRPVLLQSGDLLTYSGTVTNTGNITLINVAVMDNQPAPGTLLLTIPFLAPGESQTYTGSYLVPPDFCGDDTVTANAFDSCSYALVTNSATANCPVAPHNPSISVTKNCPLLPVTHGGPVVYSGSVSNAGNVTLINVYVVDNQPSNNAPVIGPITLAPGSSFNFSGQYTAPLVCCETTDTLTARGQDRCSGSNVFATATAICPTLYTPGIALVQSCPLNPIPMGSVYAFNGYVTNTGDAILTNVLVFVPQATNARVLGPLDLAPGQAKSYSGSYTVPSNICSATISVTSQETCRGTWITNTTSCPVDTTPLLVMIQNCPVAPVIPGGLLTYSGSIRNAGNITLVNLVVTNSQTGNTPIIAVAALAPGMFTNFTGSYIAPATGLISMSTSTAHATSLCGSPVTTNVSTTCSIISSPGISITKLCPPSPVAPGGTLVFSGTLANTGDVTLTNVVVMNNQPVPNTLVLGPITLAPGASTNFTGSYSARLNACASSDTLIVTGNDAITGNVMTNAASASCPIITTPAIAITENCPTGAVAAGSSVAFNGLVSNTGDISLMNVYVFRNQPSNNTPVLGPIMLAPGDSVPFTGSYIATGGSNPTTNLTVITNSSLVITTNMTVQMGTNILANVTTNTVLPMFGTIDPVTGILTDRFSVPSNLHGLMFADQNENWGPTLFYAIHHPATGPDTLDTISTISDPVYAGSPSIGYVTNWFALTATNFSTLTMAAPNVGYGEINFYYLRHDASNWFGEIIAQGASSSSDLWPLSGSGYTGLAFASANVGTYGLNLFYYVRTNSGGLSTFGTIDPTPGGVETDRYALGTNFDSLVFVSGPVSTWGSGQFAYLRHDLTGSIIGTIDPVSHAVTDQLHLSTNLLDALTFTPTDVGYGANLFYYLRSVRITFATNFVTTFTTNIIASPVTNQVVAFVTNSAVLFTPTNTVTAVGVDLCLSRTVAAAANCLNAVTPHILAGPVTPPLVPNIGAHSQVNGVFSLSFPTEIGKWYAVQYKNDLSSPTWITLETLVGTGGNLNITDTTAAGHPTRYYQIVLLP